jgi:hypothetical protein
MKKCTLIIFVLALKCLISFCQIVQNDFPVLTGKYFGQKEPGMIPEVFAPGIVSIPDAKYNTISFSANLKEIFLYRWDGSTPRIMTSKLTDNKWSPLRDVDFTTGYKAMEPHITFDNKKLFFGWDKPAPIGEKETPFKIWYTERTSSGWMDPLYAGTGMFVSSDRDGNIYTTDMSAIMTTGKSYLAKVIIENGRFTKFERLSISQYLGAQAHPCIAPDGSFLIFDVDSGHHLFVSFKMSNGNWSDAIDLTIHGFDPEAGGASVTPDGKYLFFNCKGLLWWVNIRVIEELRPNDGQESKMW